MKGRNSFKVASVLALFLGTLVSFTPITSQAANTSYLQNTKKIYVYRAQGKNTELLTETFSRKSKDKDLKGYNIWDQHYQGQNPGRGATYEKETKKGLYNLDGLAISYPIKVGKTWKNNEGKLTIKSINKTIKVPAGTYKKVLEIKAVYGKDVVYYYYAKNVGFVLSVFHGKRATELYKLKNK